MCGIAGIVSASGDRNHLMRVMLDALRHRGPDGEGIEQDTIAVFGHRRLSIIDLLGGRQPLVNADRSIWLVCNGEIYNYRELRSDLEARGQKFLTNSDCEVIIGLYEHYGDDLLAKLRGMFAFALWDARKRRLLMARDHLGQKPLYYAHTARGFAFASEIKALLAFDPTLRAMNLQALDQYFALRLIAPPLSMFRGVHKLPAAHVLILEGNSKPQVRRYWKLEYQPKLRQSEDVLLDELEEKIEEALRLHLVSDVPVGALLSGGLDSSLIVAMLTKRIGIKDLQTFTIGLPYPRFDEAPVAREVARLCGTDHHERTLSTSLVSLLPQLIFHLDEPSDPLSLCVYQVAELARKHVKVVIGGDGGDELFGGYDRYYGNLYADQYARVPQAIRRVVLGRALGLLPTVKWYKSVGHQLQWLHRLSFLTGGERYASSLSYFYFDTPMRAELFTAEAMRELHGFNAESAIISAYETAIGAPLDRMLAADSAVRLPDHPVMITDRMSMAHGLEARSPFMDHRLAEYVARLPSDMKIKGRNLRIAQRKLVHRYLPKELLNRPKQGFSSALPYMLQREYRLLYDHFLPDSQLVKSGVVDARAIQRLLQAHLAGQADHGNRLWLLINSELWYRMMIQGESEARLRDELRRAGLSAPAAA